MLLNRPPLHEIAARAAQWHAVAQPEADPGVGTEPWPAYALETIADTAFANRDWRAAWRGYAEALRSGSILIDQRKCVLHSGRCALYLGQTEAALAIFSEFVETFPADVDGLFYLGRSFQRAHRYHDALNCLTAAQQLEPDNANIHAVAGQIAHAVAFHGFGHAEGARSGSYLAVADAAFARALDLDATNFEALSGRLMFRLDCGEVIEAIEIFVTMTEDRESFDDERLSRVAINLALGLARIGRLGDVAGLGYLAEFPAGERLLARARSLSRVMPETPTAISAASSVIRHDPAQNAWISAPCRDRLVSADGNGALADPFAAVSAEADWVAPIRTTHWAGIRRLAGVLAALPADFAGIATYARPAADGEAPPVTNLLIRKKNWDELVISLPHPPDWRQATQLALDRLRIHAYASQPAPTGAPDLSSWRKHLPDRQRVLVLSRHGPRRLGGGEQFLSDAAAQYAQAIDTEVLFAGLTDDPLEALADWPAGRRVPAEGFLPDDAEALRGFCMAAQVTAIHTISGLGELVLEATSGLDIRRVYGVHFWREFVAGDLASRPHYPRIGDAMPAESLRSFEVMLASFDNVYVNSDYCADLAADLYRWHPQVLYSVPPRAAVAPGESGAPKFWAEDVVLLANARADKGWHLFLDVAEALPHRQFVAIAGQTDVEAARADVQHRSLFNVTVIDRAEDMTALYAAARVVLVPSFAFVETFSRVAVEAGRHGRPALLADAGNLSRLGAGTELLLAEETDAWSGAVERLFTDEGWHAELVRQTEALSARFDHAALLADFARLPVGGRRLRILVCAGSGIGNACHVTPMIRRLAGHHGVRVDVLVAGDFAGTAAVFAGAAEVGSVFEDYAHVRHRAYDMVLVTHCFGSVVPDFNAPVIHVSRDIDQFDPGGPLHEAEFNLAFLEAATGIGYAPGDAADYFLGNWTWSPPSASGRRPRVALHAGSKDGMWAAKRWPHFAVLARDLTRLGVDAVSLGVAEEYVPGTLDRTGLTIARMTDELAGCDALISNDSGVMNLANALGVPVVAVFAPTNPATRAPLKSPSVVLTPDTDCSPCEARPGLLERFQQGSCRCISLISPARVRKALVELGLPVPGSVE